MGSSGGDKGMGMTLEDATTTGAAAEPRLMSLGHGGGCGCKIAPAVLSELLAKMPGFPVPPELLVGTAHSDDAAVWRLNESQALVATTDFFLPVVDDPFDFGRIAATNALSDVYAMGGRPILALAIVGMPVGRLSLATIARILEGGASVCAAAGIPVAGGHSIDSAEPIYGLVALGLVHPDRVRRNTGARPGDALVLGKPLGTGVMSGALKKGLLGEAAYRLMLDTTTRLNTPGPDLAAMEAVHALTDVTGFGLAGHALELARGAGCGIMIDWARVPVMAGVRELLAQGCATGASGRNWASYGTSVALPEGFAETERALLTDPQTSGGLLVSCAPAAVEEVLGLFAAQGFAHATVIGEVGGPEPAPRLALR